MTNYITRPTGHDPTYQGPYTASGVNLRLYVLPAPFASLVALLDRYLNAAAGPGTYFPLGGSIVACFAAMAKVEGAAPNLGWMREIDVALFIPTVRLDTMLAPKIGFFAPYLFVDVPQAAATGREVHGYRKDVGTSFSAVDTFADAWIPSASDLTHVDAWAVDAPANRLRRQRLIDLTPPAVPGAPIVWGTQDAALDALFDQMVNVADVADHLLPALNLAGAALDAAVDALLRGTFKALVGALHANVPIVFLRQFRDPQHTAQADVQEVVHANTTLDLASLAVHQLPDPYQVTFHDMASHPFSAELGVPNGVPVASTLAIEATCGFVLHEAT